jgi:hypothetical protein
MGTAVRRAQRGLAGTAPPHEVDGDSRLPRLLDGSVGGSPRFAVPFLFLLAVAAIGQCYVGVIPQDEGELLTYPWLIARGVAPYTHIWMMYPPTTYVALAGLYKLGLPVLLSERALGVLVRLVSVLVVNRLLTRSFRRFSPIGVSASFVCLFLASTDMRAYPWLVGVPSFLAGVTLASRRPWLGVGLIALAGTIRYELALAGLAAVFFGALLEEITAGTGRRRFVACAVAIVVLALGYLLLGAVTSGSAIQDIFIDPVRYIGPAQHSALFPPKAGPLFSPVELYVLLAPLALIAAAIRRQNGEMLTIAAACLFVFPHFLNTADVSHLFSLGSIVLPLTLIALVRAGHSTGSGSGRLERWVLRAGTGITVWLLLTLVAFAVYLSPFSPLSSLSAASVGRVEIAAPHGVVIATSPREARDARNIVAYMHTHARPGDGVLVAPRSTNSAYTITYLYYVLNMRPATRYLEYENGVVSRPEVQREMIRELHSTRWVIELHGGDWYYAPADHKSATAFDRALRSRFIPVFHAGMYEVLRASRVG